MDALASNLKNNMTIQPCHMTMSPAWVSKMAKTDLGKLERFCLVKYLYLSIQYTLSYPI